MQAFRNFLIQGLIFTIFVSAIAFILFNTILAQFYLPVFWVLLAMITFFTAGFHFSILQVKEKETSKFASRFMLVSGVKMIAYLVLITSYVFTNPTKAKIFLISFFILYLIYTVFELVLIIRYLKKH